MSKWTQFWDMNSGGGLKEGPYSEIYIEAPEDEAVRIFYNRFGHNPNRVTCTCCGNDYSINESETLEQATAYQRNCGYVFRNPAGEVCDKKEGFVIGKGMQAGYTCGYEEVPDTLFKYGRPLVPLADYIKQPNVLVIRADEIKPEERVGKVPEQGYVWQE